MHFKNSLLLVKILLVIKTAKSFSVKPSSVAIQSDIRIIG